MNKFKKYFLMMTIIFASFLILTNIVNADNGPKPQLEIIIVNPPEDEYYLDLLVDYEVNDGYTWLKEEDYDEEKIELFKKFRVGKWRPALLTKTRAPMTGKLIGTREGDKIIHNFGYTLPDKFKIAILNSDNKFVVSDEITLRSFNSTIIYDYKNNSIINETEIDKNGVIIGTINEMLSSKGIILTCLLTLIIEGAILVLFKFTIKKNIKPFILINIFTQVLLYIVLILVTNEYNYRFFMPTLISMEVIILIIESVLFSKYLKGYSIKRKIAFSIVANIFSFFSGYLIYLFV